MIVIVDSEFITEACHCAQACSCRPPAIPVGKTFHHSSPAGKAVRLSDVKQMKGEAEMSQVDWLIEEGAKLKPGEAAASIVTSGDIDSIYIHLFAISLHWPRDENDKFKNAVYIILQKPSLKQDVFNVTLMLELFESVFSDKTIGVKFAVALCIGGTILSQSFNTYLIKLLSKSCLTQPSIENLCLIPYQAVALYLMKTVSSAL